MNLSAEDLRALHIALFGEDVRVEQMAKEAEDRAKVRQDEKAKE